jgi:Na+/melibiose symporter-like transporter
MKARVRIGELINLNAYWLGLSFMWNSLHVLVLPAVLLSFVSDARKNTALGLLTFVGLIVAMIVQPLSGGLSDRWTTRIGRRRPWIAIGSGLDLIFLALLAASTNLVLLAVAYIGLQLTSNLAHGPAQGLMHDRVPTSQMGMASGVKNVFDMAGLVISSLLIGRVLDPQHIGSAMAIIAGFLLLGAAFTLFGVREQRDPIQHESEMEGLPPLRELGIRTHPAFWRLIVVRLLFLSGVYGVQTFAQYYIRDTLNVADPVKLTGDLLATIVLTLIGFSILAGYLSDRFGRKPMHLVATIFVVVGSLLMTIADSSSSILIYGSVIGAGIGLFISANWALANDLAPVGQAGKFLGLTNLATAGAGALSRLAGPGIDWINALQPGAFLGYTALFIATAVMALASLGILVGVPESHGRSSTQASPDSLPPES